jgi:mono/diheme cytochrome c family protein
MVKSRLLKRILLVAAILILGIQLVPYGRSHANPSARIEPTWDSARTRELAQRACFDCHSNETVWPWYANGAPASWLIQRDVDEGREDLNFSEWQRPQKEANEAAATIREGKMPPWTYTVIHPGARLNAQERSALIKGLEATLGAESSGTSK